jgi:hypothetical protein
MLWSGHALGQTVATVRAVSTLMARRTFDNFLCLISLSGGIWATALSSVTFSRILLFDFEVENDDLTT